MGGDRLPLSLSHSSIDEESTLDQEFPEKPHGLFTSLDNDALSPKVGVEKSGSFCGQFDNRGRKVSSNSLAFEANQRRKRYVYAEVLKTYSDLRLRNEHLEEAKRKILSYTPGSWIEKGGETTARDYDVPKTTSLLLLGPRGSGKSSLINKISRVFEDDIFASERAQVSYNSSVGDGTYFVHEYMIPRGSSSFCIFDTRSLSDESSENIKVLERWMTKGIRHGELIERDSDEISLKLKLKCKARLSDRYSCDAVMVNYVIFVVNGLSVLEAMENDDETKKLYTETIATTFNNPLLSFKDDKPVIVVTHGDLLSLSDRVRVRIHLGELLGIPPHKQIFDIQESCDPMAELSIVEMIRYCLEHADRNLPGKGWSKNKAPSLFKFKAFRSAYSFMLMLAIVLVSAYLYGAYFHRTPVRPPSHTQPPSVPPPSDTRIDWPAMRHLWLGMDDD